MPIANIIINFAYSQPMGKRQMRTVGFATKSSGH
jgi:hypothetical protein